MRLRSDTAEGPVQIRRAGAEGSRRRHVACQLESEAQVVLKPAVLDIERKKRGGAPLARLK